MGRARVFLRRGVFALGLCAALAGTAVLAGGEAKALDFDLGPFSGKFDSDLSVGAQLRLRNPDCKIIGNDNGGCVPIAGPLQRKAGAGAVADPDSNILNSDDGNLNYKKGDVVSAVYKGTHDLALKGPDGWGGLLRFNWSGDAVAANTRRTALLPDAKDITNLHAELLDGYVSKSFTLFGENAKIKAGNQVLSWGEDIFIPGGINIINAIDFRKFHVPGTQLKEVFRPAPMVSINTGLAHNLSAEAFYQLQWSPFVFDPVGTYFSQSDLVGPGRRPFFVASSLLGLPATTFGDETNPNNLFVVPGIDRKPKDAGQFGANLRYKLGETEVGVYYIHYHDKLPQVSLTALAGNLTSYFNDYGENRQLFGVTANRQVSTPFGDIAIGSEISYRPKDSVGIDPTVPAAGPFSITAISLADPTHQVTSRGFVSEQKYQANFTATHFFTPDSPIGRAQEAIGGVDGYWLFEAAVTDYPYLKLDGSVPYLLTDYQLPTRLSGGIVTELGITFPHVIGPINMTPVIDYSDDAFGRSPNAVPFIAGRQSIAVNLNFDYLGKAFTTLTYANFWGGGVNNLVRDRAFVGASVRYVF